MAGRYHKSLYIYINFSIAYLGFLRTFDFVPIKCIFSLFRRQGLIQDIIPHNLKYVHKSINVIFDPLHSGLKRTKWGWNGKKWPFKCFFSNLYELLTQNYKEGYRKIQYSLQWQTFFLMAMNRCQYKNDNALH